MEIVLVILLFVFFSLAGKKKTPGNAPRRGAPRPSALAREAVEKAAREAASPAVKSVANSNAGRDFLKELRGLLDDETDEAKPAKPAPAKAQPKPAKAKRNHTAEAPSKPVQAVAQGASMLDEEGCVGGSMDHGHDEGESHAEHARHLAEAKRREAEELLNQADAQRRAQVSARKLREAVVMAEVLGKPRALRPRGQGRYIG